MFKWQRIVFVIFFCLLLIILQSRNKELSTPFKGLIGNVLNPLVYFASNIFFSTSSIWDSYVHLIGVQEENEEMKKELDRINLENSLLRERLIVTEHLESFLKFNKVFDFSTVPANVIGIGDGFLKSIIIDRGSIDGILKNDPVIGFNGLVGKVTDVYLKSSKVELVLAASSNVSVINSKTRAFGILRGDGAGGIWVDFYDRLDNVSIGDNFITSGLGKLFPKGIPIGQVSEIEVSNKGLFKKVTIKQFEDFYKLENVFIIKDFKE